MSNLHRIQWIDAQIRAFHYPNARTVAERFEISPRQAARDIEYLRYSMGAPLVYSSDKNGYFYENDAFALPAMFLNADDKQTLSYLALQYRNLGSESASRLADLLNKLGGDEETQANPEEYIPAFEVDAKKSGLYIQLHKAAVRQTKVRMRYCNQKNEISERIFCPYKLFSRQQVDYVAGFCELRREVRVFRMDRIRQIHVLEDGFQVNPEFKPDDYSEDILFRSRKPYMARISFCNAADFDKLRLKGEWIDAHTIQVEFFDSAEIIAELLRQTGEFRILAPQWLSQRLIKRLKKIIEDHNGV